MIKLNDGKTSIEIVPLYSPSTTLAENVVYGDLYIDEDNIKRRDIIGTELDVVEIQSHLIGYYYSTNEGGNCGKGYCKVFQPKNSILT